MREEIFINGKKYDAITGEILDVPKAIRKSAKESVSNKIHEGLQRSSTLNRKYVKIPKRSIKVTPHQEEMISQFKRRHDYQEAILRSRENKATKEDRLLISRFAKDSKIISPIIQDKDIEDEIAPFTPHPLQEKANQAIRAKKNSNISDNEIKAAAISEALEKARSEHKKARPTRVKNFFVSKRFATFLSGFTIIIIGLAYLTLLNMPEIAARITSIQSGMSVELPNYIANGFSQKGLAYFDGKSVNFEYKRGDVDYKIQQSESGWDSLALLQNYVTTKWSGEYSTVYSDGLTIYSNRHGESVWVNDGKLFKISDSSNKLSIEEVRKIATGINA